MYAGNIGLVGRFMFDIASMSELVGKFVFDKDPSECL